MEDYVAEALRQGFISWSGSPDSAGFFFVEKKDGGLHIDYRGLNVLTVKYRHPFSLVPLAIKQLRGSTIYTKLDLRSAYNLVCIHTGNKWRTAFSTMSGHYQYNVMATGLVNPPSFFQAFMNNILHDMLNWFVIVYLDDILLYSKTYPFNR